MPKSAPGGVLAKSYEKPSLVIRNDLGKHGA